MARYIGPAAELAFNGGVLRESLRGLDGQAIVSASLDSIDGLQWVPVSATDGATRVLVPAGWMVEPGGPSACPRLPAPNAVIAAYAPGDFSTGVRVAVWSAADFTPELAASACSMAGTPAGSAVYASRGDWLGVSYSMEGTFLRLAPGRIVRLEVIAPDQRSAFIHALLGA